MYRLYLLLARYARPRFTLLTLPPPLRLYDYTERSDIEDINNVADPVHSYRRQPVPTEFQYKRSADKSVGSCDRLVLLQQVFWF